MIESTMEPVIIPFDDNARKAVEELTVEKIPSGLIARKLQTYVVQVPPKARDMLVHFGHVEFAEPKLRGNQFAVLKASSMGERRDSIYNRERGLLWETPEYMAVENMII